MMSRYLWSCFANIYEYIYSKYRNEANFQSSDRSQIGQTTMAGKLRLTHLRFIGLPIICPQFSPKRSFSTILVFYLCYCKCLLIFFSDFNLFYGKWVQIFKLIKYICLCVSMLSKFINKIPLKTQWRGLLNQYFWLPFANKNCFKFKENVFSLIYFHKFNNKIKCIDVYLSGNYCLLNRWKNLVLLYFFKLSFFFYC